MNAADATAHQARNDRDGKLSHHGVNGGEGGLGHGVIEAGSAFSRRNLAGSAPAGMHRTGVPVHARGVVSSVVRRG
ncbi:hypothetical protein AB0H83_51000 [Dactylosporangium sp. NPDC050688]|uniref:hypothetical protein n=1 Tax=Dactylosporangium sp. NPDC050688 TaxID=3157217 RepID=UPI0033D09CBD